MSQCTNRDLPALAGRFLKQTLIARGITQEQFAEMTHVSDRTVRRWVSGEIHSLDALSDIANALQVEVRDIFAEDVPFELFFWGGGEGGSTIVIITVLCYNKNSLIT